MTPNQAHDYAMGIVKELQSAGIVVTIKPHESTEGRTKEWSKHHSEMIAKYGNQPDRSSPDKWCNVRLKPETDDHRQLLRQKQKELGWMGICFDSGGGCDGRDWELDWSFRLQEGVPDGERERAVEATNDLIDGLENGTLKGPPE